MPLIPEATVIATTNMTGSEIESEIVIIERGTGGMSTTIDKHLIGTLVIEISAIFATHETFEIRTIAKEKGTIGILVIETSGIPEIFATLGTETYEICVVLAIYEILETYETREICETHGICVICVIVETHTLCDGQTIAGQSRTLRTASIGALTAEPCFQKYRRRSRSSERGLRLDLR